MKHLEIEPNAARAVKAPAPGKQPLAGARILLGALLLVAGAGYGLTTWWNPLPTDRITAKEKAELVTQFTHLRAIEAEQVKAEDVDTALDSMRLDPSSRQALKQTIAISPTGSASTALVNIVLWDFAAPDGDVVRISSAGYEIEVPLVNAPTTIAVPTDGSHSIKLAGVHDGGGGITVGIQSGAGKVFLPVLGEGEVLTLPVSF